MLKTILASILYFQEVCLVHPSCALGKKASFQQKHIMKNLFEGEKTLQELIFGFSFK